MKIQSLPGKDDGSENPHQYMIHVGDHEMIDITHLFYPPNELIYSFLSVL